MKDAYGILMDKVLDVLIDSNASPLLAMEVIGTLMVAIAKIEEEDRQQGDA